MRILLTVLALHPVVSLAQDDDKAASGKAISELVQRLSAQEIQRVYQSQLLLEVSELTELFKLDKAKTRKLSVAARGAASRTVAAAEESIKTTVTRLVDRRLTPETDRTHITFNGKREKIETKVVDDAKRIPERLTPPDTLGITVSWHSNRFSFMVRHGRGSTSTSIGPRVTELRSQAIWKKTLSETLTPAQLKEYEVLRTKQMKATAVAILITAFKYELHLKDSQIPAVREVLNKSITLTTDRYSSNVDSLTNLCAKQVKAEEMAKVLTEQQLALWKSGQAYHLRYGR